MSYRYEDDLEDDDPTEELEILSGAIAALKEDDDSADGDSPPPSTSAANQPFENEQLGSDLREANERITELSSELQQRSETMKSIQLELKRLRGFSEFLEKEVESGKGIISDVTDELIEVRTQQNDATEQLRRREQQIEVLEGKLARKEAFISEFTQQVDTSTSHIDHNFDDWNSSPGPVEPGIGAGDESHHDVNECGKRLRMLAAMYNGSQKRFPIMSGRMTIGTGPANDLCLDHGFVSYRHAQITETAAGCVLKDLGSSNGTWINRRRVKWQVLRDGDLVDIGPLRFEFIDRPVEVVDVRANDEVDS